MTTKSKKEGQKKSHTLKRALKSLVEAWKNFFVFSRLRQGTQRKREKQGKKFPTRNQWRQFFKVLNKKEKAIFFALLCLVFASSVSLSFNFYSKSTTTAPSHGGAYREGVIGQPRFMNPLYLSTQDVDRDIVELLFSGLMKYNEEGEIVEDLAKNYEVKEEGKLFDVYLKDNIFWHDGTPLTADDIIFTVNLVQEPQSQSPLRVQWMGITPEKISEKAVRFRLPKKYSAFLENLALKIIPKHIFQDIAPQDLPWKLVSKKYLIGSGPFKVKKITEDKSGHIKRIDFERSENYHKAKPYLDELSFIFYPDADALLKAGKIGDIDGFSLTDPKYFRGTANGFQSYLLSIPRYFALFFNLRAKNIFIEKEVRYALALAINKEELLQDVFSKKGKQVDSPILPQFFGFKTASTIYNFNSDEATKILETAGFQINPETQKREKLVIHEPAFTFTKNLFYKDKGEDVIQLQKCLANPPAGGPDVYPEGEITGVFGSKTKAAVLRFQEKYAKEILEPIGLKKGTGDVKPMTRDKLNEICFEKPKEIVPLKITLTTSDKFPLPELAEAIKKNWEEIGADVNINKVPLSELQTNALSKRDFEILLFGEALGSIPDPFPFWHSSQKDHPGLNISSYTSKEADKLLEKAREAQNEGERKENLEKFQEVLIDDLPAIFLVRPDYIYNLSPKIKGFKMEKITEPAKRFSTVEQWYIKTRMVWK